MAERASPTNGSGATGASAAELVTELRSRVAGEVRADEPLGRHTTLRVGGPAAAFVVAEGAADLAAIAEVCAESGRPWLVVGRGSNLLVPDEGWPGVAVTLGQGFRGVRVEGSLVEAGAAEPMPALAMEVARSGLGGLAFGIAIPGTVGGAVRMNAGAHGGEIADVLAWADVARLAQGGVVERIPADALGLTYRHSDLPPDAVVVRAGLRLARTDQETLEAEMAEMRRWRRVNQPLSEPTCGSVFANPPGDSAGRLIDSAGLKGHRVGGAQVSTKHANFIIGGPEATASDVRRLILEVADIVADRHGVRLRTEVVIVGFDDGAGG